MTRQEMIAMVRKLIADEQSTGFTEGGNLEEPTGTEELLNYLDRAVDEYSKRQAMAKDVRLMKEADVINGAELPTDYISFCGGMPVRVLGNKLKFYDSGTAKLTIRYMGRLPYVTSYKDGDTVGYETDQATAIMALAAIYALNKMELPVTQSLMLMGYGAVQE